MALAHVLHLKPLAVPLQVPVRCCPEGHWVLEQVVQVPFLVEDDPRRYWLALQAGWLTTASVISQRPFGLPAL